MHNVIRGHAGKPALQPGLVAHAPAGFVIVAGYYLGRGNGKFRYSLEHVFRSVWSEVRYKFVVDGQVGGKNKEMAYALGPVEIGYKSAHKARFAHACGKGKAHGREVPLKVFYRGEIRPKGGQRFGNIGFFLKRQQFAQTGEYFKRFPLWGAQAEAAGYGVYMLVHFASPSVPETSKSVAWSRRSALERGLLWTTGSSAGFWGSSFISRL